MDAAAFLAEVNVGEMDEPERSTHGTLVFEWLNRDVIGKRVAIILRPVSLFASSDPWKVRPSRTWRMGRFATAS
jgi:hypothetical protein